MAASSADEGSTGAGLLVSTPQPDDSGAETADRYEWQAAMAAADGLRQLYDALDDQGKLPVADDRRIICEYHEDWAACHGEDAELVSAKHKEPSYGAFSTVNKLVNDGGIAHLFGRWCELGEKPSCRLVTTAGLASGPAQRIEKATVLLRDQRLAGKGIKADGDYASEIKALAEAILAQASGLPDAWRGADGAPIAELNPEHYERYSGVA